MIDPARVAALGLIALAAFAIPAASKQRRDDAYIRMLACEGPDAKMELYVPQSIVFGGKPLAQALAQPVTAYYALDLTAANKGKPLEPVEVSISPDGKTVIINQYTRGLPPARVPVGGGTVDFDRRFGTNTKCGAFQSQDPNYGDQQ